MRRLLWILPLLLLLASCNNYRASRGPADWIYVATTGNDGTGDGSAGAPYLTLGHAVTQATSGDTIYINSGTYTIAAAVDVPVGVFITSDPDDRATLNCTFINTSITQAAIRFVSAAGGASTAGNQSISHINFAGGDTGGAAIAVYFRSNVIIHDCNFTGFLHRAIAFYATNATLTTTPPMAIPTHFATGNKIYNCIITNSATRAQSIYWGSIYIAGQHGMEVYGNTLTANSTTLYNPDNIAGFANKGLKLHDNTFIRNDIEPTPYWNFFMEMHNSIGGMEVYDNVFIGAASVDMSGAIKGDYAFGWKVHHNNFNTSTGTLAAAGEDILPYLSIESFDVAEDYYICYNYFKNARKGIWITNSQTSVSRIYIYYNVFDGIGNSTNAYSSAIHVTSMWGANEPRPFNDIFIWNNVISANANTLEAIAYSIYGNLEGGGIQNNIFYNGNKIARPVNFSGNYSGCEVNDYFINNNIVYQSSTSNDIRYSTGTYPATFNILDDTSDVIVADPLFRTGNFRLQSTSPAINAGTSVSLTSDFAGHRVPQQDTVDIGAYEYGDYLFRTPSGKLLRNANGKFMITH